MNEVGTMTVDVSPVAEMMSQAMVNVAQEYGIWVMIFALLGVISMVNAAARTANPVFKWGIILLVITPMIVVRSMVDKQYGEVFTKEYHAIRAYIKENPRAKWLIVRYVGGICLIGGLVITQMVIEWHKMG